MRTLKLILVFVTLVIMSSGCEKEAAPKRIDQQDSTGTNDLSAPNDIIMAERLFVEIQKIVNNSIRRNPSTLPPPPPYFSQVSTKGDSIENPCPLCPVIEFGHDGNNPYNQHMRIDYGQDGIVGEDSILRKGCISVTYNGMFNQKGATSTTEIKNFYIDGYTVSGTKHQTNMGVNENYHLVFKDEIVDAVITTPDGKTMKWSQTSESTWVMGGKTPEQGDDEYLITGQRSGIDTKGRNYTVDILKPLNVLMSCQWIRGGQTKTTLQDAPYPILIDFGEGGCDTDAKLEVNGKSIAIKLE